MINQCLIAKHGLYGCSNSDLRAIIKANPRKHRLVELCRKMIKSNKWQGRE